MRKRSGPYTAVPCLLSVLFLTTAPVAAQEPARGLFITGPDSQVETIALTTAAGGPFESIGRYKVNALGEVAFLASREGKLGLYLYTNGGLVVILREGQPIPGDSQLSFTRDEDDGFTFELSDSGGVVLIGASLTNDLNGVFLYSSSTLETVIRAGHVGHDGSVLESVTPLRYTSDGRVIFLGETLIDTSAVYSYDPEKEEYVHHWFDCVGSPVQVFRGQFEGNVLSLEGRTPMGFARSAVDFSQPDKMLVRYEVSTDGKVWDCLFEGVYERQS